MKRIYARVATDHDEDDTQRGVFPKREGLSIFATRKEFETVLFLCAVCRTRISPLFVSVWVSLSLSLSLHFPLPSNHHLLPVFSSHIPSEILAVF